MRSRVVRVALAVLALALALSIGAAAWWALTPLGPDETAVDALAGSSAVRVSSTSYGWLFEPAAGTPETGLVFYPGGRVDARSYAPLAASIAERGHAVALLRVPLSLAVLAPNAADAPLRQEAGIGTWVIAGHSLGGVMAASYAAEHPDTVGGLLLLASYPSVDLSAARMPVTSVTGTLDTVLDREAWQKAKRLLPLSARISEIEGGNHAQFGSYGEQPGDTPAAITPEVQQALTATEADDLFSVKARPAPAP